MKHSLLYAVLSSIVLIFFASNEILNYTIVILLFLSHGLIDYIKIYFKNKYKSKNTQLFFIDQLIHIIILFLIVNFIDTNFFVAYELNIDLIYFDYLIALLLVSKIANVIFKMVFENFKPEDEDNSKVSIENGHKNAGALIGSMERILILICLLSGNFATIGFVIAAKSVARFEKLSKTQFGEYFLLGTLFSVLYTMLVYYVLFTI